MAILARSGWVFSSHVKASHVSALGGFFALALAACGGGPAMQNAPRPSSTVVAGAVAATAAAITLADPDGAARNVNSERELYRPIEPVKSTSGVTAPAAVLDRLDAAERQAREDRKRPPSAEQDPDSPAPAPARLSPYRADPDSTKAAPTNMAPRPFQPPAGADPRPSPGS
jgi:hypothetical protein